MENLWQEIVAAHDELIDSVLGAFNINSTEISDNTTIFEILEKFLWSSSSNADKSASDGNLSLTQTVFGDFAKGTKRFINAINWREPFFVGLFIVHALLLSGTVAAFRAGIDSNFYLAWMLSLFGFVYLATSINEYAGTIAADYLFTKGGANYFDEHGMFISVVWSIPLMLQLLLMLLGMVANAAKLFAVNKIRKAHLERAKAGDNNNSTKTTTTTRKAVEGKKKK